MAYNFSFADNGLYGAEDLNKITSRLVTEGVQDTFENGTPYNLSAFNESGALLYTEGVVPESVLTLKVVSGNGENTILINPGTAFFKDGSVIEIEEGGHELSFVSGVKNYVYLKNNLVSENASYPVCSESIPTGDFVLLAEIEENGEILDKRTYAKGKLPGYASSSGYRMQITDTINTNDMEKSGYQYKVTKTYEIGDGAFNFVISMAYPNAASNSNGCLGVYDLSDKRCISFAGIGSDCMRSLGALYLFRNNLGYCYAGVSISNGILTLNITYYNDITDINQSIPINLYLV